MSVSRDTSCGAVMVILLLTWLEAVCLLVAPHVWFNYSLLVQLIMLVHQIWGISYVARDDEYH